MPPVPRIGLEARTTCSQTRRELPYLRTKTFTGSAATSCPVTCLSKPQADLLTQLDLPAPSRPSTFNHTPLTSQNPTAHRNDH